MVTFINLIAIYGSPNAFYDEQLTLSQQIFGIWGNQNATSQNIALFSPLWYQKYYTTIVSILLLTPFIPYVSEILIYLVAKICCCKSTPNKGSFAINKKTVYFVSTIIIIFSTGFGRFDFFFCGFISFAFQFFLDKIFITYWYKPT